MERQKAKEYVGFVVDDALCGRRLGDDIHAVIHEHNTNVKYGSVLVGWQCGFEPMFVAVHSYLDVELTDDECVELATDYLEERDWFADGPREPDYIIR